MNLLTRLKKSVRHRTSYKLSKPLSRLLGATGFGMYGAGPQLQDAGPLRRAGLPLEQYPFDLADVDRFWKELSARSEVLRQWCERKPYWEKIPQYSFTWKHLEQLRAREDAVYVDNASTPASPYFEVLHLLARTRKLYRQDLVFPAGVHGDRIGGSAAELPLDASSVDAMTLHCSYEHFEGDADTGFIRIAPWIEPDPGIANPALTLAERRALLAADGS